MACRFHSWSTDRHENWTKALHVCWVGGYGWRVSSMNIGWNMFAEYRAWCQLRYYCTEMSAVREKC